MEQARSVHVVCLKGLIGNLHRISYIVLLYHGLVQNRLNYDLMHKEMGVAHGMPKS